VLKMNKMNTFFLHLVFDACGFKLVEVLKMWIMHGFFLLVLFFRVVS